MITRLRNLTAGHTYLVNGFHFEPGTTLAVDLATVPEWCGVWRGLHLGLVVDLDAEPVLEPTREYTVEDVRPVAPVVEEQKRRRTRRG